MWLSLFTALLLTTSPVRPADIGPEALYGENVYARLWRSANNRPPQLGDKGWPHYTAGSYNNTPPSDTQAGVFMKTRASGWTSGFFPDSLWQAYRRRTQLRSEEHFTDEPTSTEWLTMAQAWTAPLETNINLTTTHDLGFMAKPFESAMQINGDDWLDMLRNMSINLGTRFEPKAGIIRSWNCANESSSAWCSPEDSVLVIIDNMMNLALLARSASNYTNNQTLLDFAQTHADKTIENHVREDGSSFHVCDYSATSGDVYLCRTAQGLADNSTWARGQAWGIYGFAEIYSLTGRHIYRDTSMRMADWFIEHLPEDGLPYWDFDAMIDLDSTPRDTSAATIAASGLLLLNEALDREQHRNAKHDYKAAAVSLLEASIDFALAAEVSFADPGTLGADTEIDTVAGSSTSIGFEGILMHGTSNNNPMADPKIYDTALSHGDFYFVEAANRLLELEYRR